MNYKLMQIKAELEKLNTANLDLPIPKNNTDRKLNMAVERVFTEEMVLLRCVYELVKCMIADSQQNVQLDSGPFVNDA